MTTLEDQANLDITKSIAALRDSALLKLGVNTKWTTSGVDYDALCNPHGKYFDNASLEADIESFYGEPIVHDYGSLSTAFTEVSSTKNQESNEKSNTKQVFRSGPRQDGKRGRTAKQVTIKKATRIGDKKGSAAKSKRSKTRKSSIKKKKSISKAKKNNSRKAKVNKDSKKKKAMKRIKKNDRKVRKKKANKQKGQNINFVPVRPQGHLRCHDVIVAPGKLGIVVKSAVQGATIIQVKEGSPLQNVVFPGDVIIAIDGTDTRCMSGPEITVIMALKGAKARRLTVLSQIEAVENNAGNRESNVEEKGEEDSWNMKSIKVMRIAKNDLKGEDVSLLTTPKMEDGPDTPKPEGEEMKTPKDKSHGKARIRIHTCPSKDEIEEFTLLRSEAENEDTIEDGEDISILSEPEGVIDENLEKDKGIEIEISCSESDISSYASETPNFLQKMKNSIKPLRLDLVKSIKHITIKRGKNVESDEPNEQEKSLKSFIDSQASVTTNIIRKGREWEVLVVHGSNSETEEASVLAEQSVQSEKGMDEVPPHEENSGQHQNGQSDDQSLLSVMFNWTICTDKNRDEGLPHPSIPGEIQKEIDEGSLHQETSGEKQTETQETSGEKQTENDDRSILSHMFHWTLPQCADAEHPVPLIPQCADDEHPVPLMPQCVDDERSVSL